MSWYQIAEGSQLEQGDLIQNCPSFEPPDDLVFPLNPGDPATVDINTYDVVVLTNSCDLVLSKVRYVAVCPHWDISRAEEQDGSLAGKRIQNMIRKGNMPRYAMLARSDEPELSMGLRVVDFGRVFNLPKDFLIKFVANQGKHLRLCSPYREHVSQAFARFFMRVALPETIKPLE